MNPPPVRNAAMRRYLRTKAVAFWLFPFLATGVIRLAFFDARWLWAISPILFASIAVVVAALPVLAHRRATHGLPIKYLGLHSGRRLKILWWGLFPKAPPAREFRTGAASDLRLLLRYAQNKGIPHLTAYTTELRGIDLNRLLQHLGVAADWEANQSSASLSFGEAVGTGLSAFPELLLSLYVLGIRALRAHISGQQSQRQSVPEAYRRHLGVPELWRLSRRAGTTGLSPEGKEGHAPSATFPSATGIGG